MMGIEASFMIQILRSENHWAMHWAGYVKQREIDFLYPFLRFPAVKQGLNVNPCPQSALFSSMLDFRQGMQLPRADACCR